MSTLRVFEEGFTLGFEREEINKERTSLTAVVQPGMLLHIYQSAGLANSLLGLLFYPCCIDENDLFRTYVDHLLQEASSGGNSFKRRTLPRVSPDIDVLTLRCIVDETLKTMELNNGHRPFDPPC